MTVDQLLFAALQSVLHNESGSTVVFVEHYGRGQQSADHYQRTDATFGIHHTSASVYERRARPIVVARSSQNAARRLVD